MTVQTSKITKKQRECLNLLVRLNSSITFVFNNRPSTVSFETEDATIILSELESIKTVLTPSQYAKLRMIFDESFVYTPRTRRTTAAIQAAPVVITPEPIQEVKQEAMPILESESNFEVTEIDEEKPKALSRIRGNAHRDAINEMTQAEFNSLATTQLYNMLKQEVPIDHNLQIVEPEPVKPTNPWHTMNDERTFTNPYAIKQPIKKEEGPDNVWDKYEDLSDSWYLSETIYKEEKDGFTLSFKNKISKSTLSVIGPVYIEDEQYKAWREKQIEEQNKRKANSMLW